MNDPQAPRRGELRIYLGAAPGVGKTYDMLAEAHRRVERGTDVVVGLVDTRERRQTTALLDGLEILPRRQLHYQGHEFTELDVEAVLARAPRVAIVDDLAHTNIAGSANSKRWQDIEQLLTAGITVLSTLNIEHLDSVTDVVEHITGRAQPETVPDEVVRRAEQIELVDITPQALRRRMAHGNIYPPGKIDAALSHYFALSSLTALRELALLWVADQVDTALQRYRSDWCITEAWEIRERVVVAITGGPESTTLIRRGSRIAARAGGELFVLHILRTDGSAGTSTEGLARCRTLAADLGASFHTVVGDDVPVALLHFARGVNATQLVLGTSRRGRLARVVDEGIGAAVVRQSGPIDVHMVTHDQATPDLRLPGYRAALPRSRQLLGWLLAVALPASVTALGLWLHSYIGVPTDVVGYFLATVLVALIGGLGPALLTAIAGAALLNFFFTEPRYSLGIADVQNVIVLAVMLVVAVLVALVVNTAARRAEQARQAHTEAALLADYARTVLTHPEPLTKLLAKVRENFSLSSVALLEHTQARWQLADWVGQQPSTRPSEADVDVAITPGVHLALQGKVLEAQARRALETAGGQALLALRAQRMATRDAEAKREAAAAELRTALLAAVGHDLRTPLASIKAAIGTLRTPQLQLSDADTAELLDTVEESTQRLHALVDNLLDSSRLATGALCPALTPVGYDEVVLRALSGLDEDDRITLDLDESIPPVLADVGLLERVVANLVDNALRHAAPAPITLRSSAHGEQVQLRIVDQGPGVDTDTAESLFAPFRHSGDRNSTAGLGLGLHVAHGFTEAMHGSITAEDTPGGGLTVMISLPQAPGPTTTQRTNE